MALTAYSDESGTHGGAVASAMAGFVGDARQWRKFEKRVRENIYDSCQTYFMPSDVRRTDKAFKGWTVDRKIEFLDEFQHIINETLESGVCAVIRDEDYMYYAI